MSTFTSPEREKFRLSMLLNDKRYRSYTFQFFALFVLICIIS
ncbi:MAG: amino acid ABC transporter permease, partial [Planktomarina sp.]|nr:amino acid ABC transporter permease [Planktomarina sp.]